MPKNTGFRISRQLEERLHAAVRNPTRSTAYMASPEWRGDQEKLRQSAAGLGGSTQPVPQKKPVRRKKGAGRKPSLTQEEIARLQQAYRGLLAKDPKFKNQTLAAQRLGRLLPKDKRDLNPRTLIRHVIKRTK
jgi:hypothetical protein